MDHIKNLNTNKSNKSLIIFRATDGAAPTPPTRSSGSGGGYDIYASLPRSLKKEVMVRSIIEEDEELVKHFFS